MIEDPSTDSETFSIPMPSSAVADDVDGGFEAESLLSWDTGLPVDVPSIATLWDLERQCEAWRRDAEFWQLIAVGAAHALCGQPELPIELWPHAIAALKARRYHDWAGHEFDAAEAAICGEVNLFIQHVFQGDDDMPATKPKPAKEKPPIQETDAELLATSLSYGEIIGPHTDAELLTKIKKRWVQAKVFTKRKYHVAVKNIAYGVAIWFDVDDTDDVLGRPAYWYDEQEDDPLGRGFLLDEVRRVLKVSYRNDAEAPPKEPAAETSFDDLKSKGKSRAKSVTEVLADPQSATSEEVIEVLVDAHESGNGKGAKGKRETKGAIPETKTSPAELLAGVIVVEERDVPYKDIVRSKFNPRQNFSEALIAELRPNIETICRLTPITVRETSLEIIDGETRHRAAAGVVTALRCKIVRCTDAQAALMRLQTSVQRRDLNPIEKAQALQELLDKHGVSQRQLSDLVKLEQGTIANLTRLLKLPQNWKDKVISGEITGAAARELVPWADETAVLRNLEKQLGQTAKEKRSIALSDLLEESLIQESRPLKDSYYYDNKRRVRNVDLKPTQAERDELRVRKLKLYHSEEEFCFNVDLWEKLQAADEAKRLAAETKKIERETGSKGGGVDRAKEAENAKRQREIIQKRIYRYRIAWLQSQLITKIPKQSPAKLLQYALWFAGRGEASSRRGGSLVRMFRPGKSNGYISDNEKQLAKLLELSDAKTIEPARELLQEWIADTFEGYHASLTPEMIEVLAVDAGVDLKRDWPSTCQAKSRADEVPDPLTGYLMLLNKDQLIDHASEWGIRTGTFGFSGHHQNRTQLIDALSKCCRGKPAPKALLDVKPIRLV